MIRHAPSIGLGLGISLRSSAQLVTGIDSDVQAFATESGATDLTGLNDLVVYLKGQGLYSDFVIYPMIAAQNAGSGSTVYGLGGWTTNDIATTNSPTWSAGGVDFEVAGSTGSVTLTGLQSLSAGLVFTRFKPRLASSIDAASSSYRWWFGSTAGTMYLSSAAATGSFTGETYVTLQEQAAGGNDRTSSSSASWSAGEDFCEVCEFGTFGSGAAVYKDKTAFAMDHTAVGSQNFSPAGTGYTADDIMGISTIQSAGTAELTGEYVASAFCKVALTTLQRETLTDYINAL